MVHLHKEILPKGTYNKLKTKKIRPCRIMEKKNDNAYQVELPKDLDISPIFNVSNLFNVHGDNGDVEVVDTINWDQQLPKKKKEHITQVLDKKVITTRQGSYNKYLVYWEGLS